MSYGRSSRRKPQRISLGRKSNWNPFLLSNPVELFERGSPRSLPDSKSVCIACTKKETALLLLLKICKIKMHHRQSNNKVKQKEKKRQEKETVAETSRPPFPLLRPASLYPATTSMTFSTENVHRLPTTTHDHNERWKDSRKGCDIEALLPPH